MKFSVLMTVYAKDHEEYLFDALESLRMQTLQASEIILVEDGPVGDGIRAVIDHHRKLQTIHSVTLPENMGLAAALNVGLDRCAYDLVARMDSDDICMPNRFETQINFMMNHPEVAASSAWVEEFGLDEKQGLIRKLPAEHGDIEKFAKRRSPLSHPVVMFRRSAVLAVGGYPSFRNSQDYALWSLMLVSGCRLANIPQILLRMRFSNEGIRRRGFKYFLQELKILRYQRSIKFLSLNEYYSNVILRFFVRAVPDSIKRVLYRVAR